MVNASLAMPSFTERAWRFLPTYGGELRAGEEAAAARAWAMANGSLVEVGVSGQQPASVAKVDALLAAWRNRNAPAAMDGEDEANPFPPG